MKTKLEVLSLETNKLCPFLYKKIIIHNSLSDARVLDFGINSLRDNDIIFSDFLPCKLDECMLYDNEKKECKYCRNAHML